MRNFDKPIFAVFLLMPTVLFAASSSDESEEVTRKPLEEVVVTANQLNTTVGETSYSLSIFLDDDLRKQTDRDLNDLLGRIPNIEVDPLEGVIVRGLAEKGLGGDLRVTLYLIDGAWTPGIFHKWDMDQLEVLRGTQSTVGSSAGGTFGLKYKEPGFEPNGTVMVNHEGDANDTEIGVAFGAPLVEDRLAFRVAGYQRKSDGRISNSLLDKANWNSFDETFARAKINWYPEKLKGDELSLEVYHLDRLSNGSGWVNEVGAAGEDAFNRVTAIERGVFFEEKITDFRLRYKGRLSDRLSVQASASYNVRKDHRIQDRNNQPSDDGYIESINDNTNYSIGATFQYGLNRWQFSGSFYSFDFNTANTTDTHINLQFTPVGVDWRIRYVLDNNNWLINGMRLTSNYNADRWYLSVALAFDDDRADTIRNTFNDRLSSTGNPAFDAFYDGIIDGAPEVSRKGKYHQFRFNPGVTFGFDVNESTTVGVKLEQATRRGWDRINAHRAQIYSYDPETSRDLDLFLRSRLFDGALLLNANLFKGNIEDQQIDYCFSAALLDCHIVNAGRTRRMGLEVDSWLFMDEFKVWVAASYLKAEFAQFTPPVLQESGVLVTNPEEETRLEDLETLDVPNAPSWKLASGLIYERDKLFASADLTVRPGTSGSVTVVDVKNDRRLLLNGRIGWRFGSGVELSVWGRNLTGKEYFLHFSPTAPGAYVGAPREFGVTMQYDWGK